jgi:hypothetical protein
MATTVVFGDAGDGWARGFNADYLTARSTVFDANSVQTSGLVGQLLSGGTYRCHEAGLIFYTGGIVGAITGAELAIASASDGSAQDFVIEARLRDLGAAMDTTDYVAGAGLGAIIPQVAFYDVAISGWSGFGYHIFTDLALPANINQSGFTGLLLNSDRHRIGDVPTIDEYVSMVFADEAGTSVDPKLTIIHDEEAPVPPSSLFFARLQWR